MLECDTIAACIFQQNPISQPNIVDYILIAVVTVWRLAMPPILSAARILIHFTMTLSDRS
jgi:hypothetical protein